jgi:GT2 family glycosyltransferase
MKLRLSIVIVTFRSKSEIATCLESIPSRVADIATEVIIVDNDSRDGTDQLIMERFPDVRFIGLSQNVGFARANNIGFDHSVGDFLLFLNPDTISNEAAYQHCLERLRSDSTIGIISPKLSMLNGEMDLACRRSIPTAWDGFCRAIGLARRFPQNRLVAGYNLTYLPENSTYEVGAVNGAFMLSSRKALARFGIFDEQYFMYGDDLDLCYRCRQAGYKVVYDGRVSIIHIKGVSSSKDAERMAHEVFRGTQQFYLKHFNPRNRSLVRVKYRLMFGAWETMARARARFHKHNKAQPL